MTRARNTVANICAHFQWEPNQLLQQLAIMISWTVTGRDERIRVGGKKRIVSAHILKEHFDQITEKGLLSQSHSPQEALPIVPIPRVAECTRIESACWEFIMVALPKAYCEDLDVKICEQLKARFEGAAATVHVWSAQVKGCLREEEPSSSGLCWQYLYTFQISLAVKSLQGDCGLL
ncbi:hypothetical protein Ocin01_16656 [Orchesella cincta]|uniref:Uncharacterized protein n=1 Tax=Orchesella cincta TaxID=48709 RepID=A0A1D2MAK7_ORCCI|nr:hypothetical protein Ocin01_16656 [Orchesella cincta]